MASRLDKISIAAPCGQDWSRMAGTEQKRFCGQCSKHVYDISAMSEAEAQQLFVSADTMPCVKLFRRKDGTIIFDNCPVGLRNVRNKFRAVMRLVSTVLATIIASPATFAKDEAKPVSAVSPGVRVDWTLSENGHTEANIEAFSMPGPNGQLAQLGVPDYNMFNYIRRSMPPVYGLSINPAFGKALKLADSGKLTLAEIEFQKALSEAERKEYDRNLTEFIATEYAGLLRKKGDMKKAELLVAKYKVADAKSVIKVSK